MVCCGSTKDHNGVEIEKLIIHRSWKKYAACFEEPHRRSKQGLGKERERERERGPRANAFIRLCEGSSLGLLGQNWIC